jgi:hypothetical protein
MPTFASQLQDEGIKRNHIAWINLSPSSGNRPRRHCCKSRLNSLAKCRGPCTDTTGPRDEEEMGEVNECQLKVATASHLRMHCKATSNKQSNDCKQRPTSDHRPQSKHFYVLEGGDGLRPKHKRNTIFFVFFFLWSPPENPKNTPRKTHHTPHAGRETLCEFGRLSKGENKRTKLSNSESPVRPPVP